MSSVRLPVPFAAYDYDKGKEPYIFISYAHIDGVLVYPEIKSLCVDHGYRIWYDEGLDPGNEWPEEIARAINTSAIFIVFISQNAVQSRNVTKEIHFALDQSKPFLAVHLEEVSLPPGLKLYMGNIQAVMKWRMSGDDYLRKMSKCLEKYGVQSGPVKPGPPPKDPAANESPPAPEKEWPPTIRPDPDGEEMVRIPAGEFVMGSNEDDNEKTPHNVFVAAFYMDKHEVTNQRFDRFVKATGFRTEAEQAGGGVFWDGTHFKQDASVNWKSPFGPGDSLQDKMELPVVQVSWNDAVAFCVWAGKRLPTEAEWEKAARGGLEGKKYPWGDVDARGRACYDQAGTGRPDSVGKYAATGYGLFDMAGNVWEWCSDWYQADYYKNSPSKNPAGPTSGEDRVLRGGTWSYYGGYLRCADRSYSLPSFRFGYVGFRCVMSC